MVSLKRPPAFDEDDRSVTFTAAGSPGPSFNPSQRKRSRTSYTPIPDDSESDAERYRLDTVPPEYGEPTPAPEASDDEVELDEDAMITIVQKDMEKLGNNVASESGIIEEVYCRNFMCHSSLRIKLGPLINFIIGHNGSGKSAVLTALRVCLGGKAADRGGSLKANIKSGEDNATLAVKIKNRGDGAYKPEVYGQSITVERQFWRNGRAGFKLKSDRDRIISTKRADLDDILDYFALHLDNPINVLSQEEARKFLSDSTPSSKYMFFLKGTQLEALDNDYNLIEEKVDSQEEALRQRAEDLAILKQKAQDAEANKRNAEQIQSLERQTYEVGKEMAWVQVVEEEKRLEGYESNVIKAGAKVSEEEGKAETVSGAYEGHRQSHEKMVHNLEELSSGLQALTDDHASAKEQWDSNRAKMLDITAQQRTIKGEVSRSKNSIKGLEKDIAEEKARLADAQGTAHTDRMEKLATLTAARAEAQQAYTDHQSEQSALIAAGTQATKDAEAAKDVQRQANDAVQSAKSSLDRAQADQGSPLSSYHPSFGGVLRDINRETRWRSKPVGPLGQHVHLLKPEWASQLETTFGNALNAFAVTCREDEMILSRILQQNSCHAPINIGSDVPLDTSDKEPSDDVDTILRVLRIDNHLVRNSLIINHYIEQVVLIQDQDRAYSYMYDSGRRSNVKAVIAFAAQRGSGTRYDYTASGAQKSGPVRAWQGPLRMKADRSEQLRLFRERLDQAKLEAEEATSRVRTLQNAQVAAQQAVTRSKRELNALRLKSQQAEDAVEEIQNEIDSNKPKDGRLQELERQLAETREELSTASGSYEDSVVQKDAIGAAGSALMARLKEAEGAVEDFNARMNKARLKLEKVDTARHNALLEKNAAIDAITRANGEVDKCKRKLQEQQVRLEEFIREASKVCPRVPVQEGSTLATLDAKMASLQQQIQRIEATAGGTAIQLTRAWKEAVVAYREARRGRDEMQKVAQMMKRALTERLRRWQLFRKYISYRAKIMFTYLLSERGFRGRLTLDHADKRLEIAIEPDLSRASADGRGAESLSGGERSYSTVCLLLSIWEAMGSPIRCLDEFDVCMDSANRATSMGMMIQAARRSVGRQFVLITPLSMDGVDLGQDVQVHRMRDPERGQR